MTQRQTPATACGRAPGAHRTARPARRRARARVLKGLASAAGLLACLPTLAQAPAGGSGFSAEQIEAGRTQFHRTCAQCHGRNMVNSGTTVYDLRKFPLDQSERFMHSVAEGKGNMPSFKASLSPEQIGVLWAYVGTRGGKEP